MVLLNFLIDFERKSLPGEYDPLKSVGQNLHIDRLGIHWQRLQVCLQVCQHTRLAYFTLHKINSSWSGLWLLILYSLCESALYQKSEWCMYSQKWNCAASFWIPTFMYLWAIYIFPGSICLYGCSKMGGRILGIYKSLTDTWMWNWQTKHYHYDLEITWLRIFISGNT